MSQDEFQQGGVVGPTTPTTRIDLNSVEGLWTLSVHGTILEHNPNRLSGPMTLLGILRISGEPAKPNRSEVHIHDIRANLAGTHFVTQGIGARLSIDGLGTGTMEFGLGVVPAGASGFQLYELNSDLAISKGVRQSNGTVIAHEISVACNDRTTVFTGHMKRVISPAS